MQEHDSKGCNEEDKRKILDSYIDFNDCTLEELLGDVKKSRLYPKEKIDRKAEEETNALPYEHFKLGMSKGINEN